MTYTIEPTDHWVAGDRAYCVRGLKVGGRHIVEQGRVYLVEKAERVRGMMPDALCLAGVDTGASSGFWSCRFVCLRGRDLAGRQIEARTRRGWLEAYQDCSAARNAQAIDARSGETVGLDPKGESAVTK